MTSHHDTLFARSVSNRTRASSRKCAEITLSGPGMPPTPIATQPNQNVREETITPQPHDEPISRTTDGSVAPADELAPNRDHGGQFDNKFVELLDEIIEDYRNQNIENF